MENLKLVLNELLGLGMAVDKAANDDGKFTLADLQYLVGPGIALPPAIAAAPAALQEWKNISAENKAVLYAWIESQFSIYDKAAEAKIEAGLEMLVQAGIFFA